MAKAKKNILKSKTLWLNIIGSALLIVNELNGKFIPTEYAGLALCILNIANRFLTSGSVTINYHA